MMQAFSLFALLLALQPPTQPAPAVDTADIVLPVIKPNPPKPVPPPLPPPAEITKLPADTLYVVVSDKPFLVTSSPEGVVSATDTAGPITIRAKFVEQPDVIQTRTFAQKYVASVESVAAGKCDLLIWPTGATDEKQIIRRPLDTGAPSPAPIPVPPVDTFQTKLQAAFTADGAPASAAAKLAALYRAASTTTVRDAGLTTGAALLAEMQKAAVTLIGKPDATLTKSRRVIGDELNATLATAGTLDARTRDVIAGLFVRIADALEGVK